MRTKAEIFRVLSQQELTFAVPPKETGLAGAVNASELTLVAFVPYLRAARPLGGPPMPIGTSLVAYEEWPVRLDGWLEKLTNRGAKVWPREVALGVRKREGE